MKNSKITSNIILFLGCILIFTACEREADHNHSNASEITLTINSPTTSQQFEAGDTVKITGVIDATEEMHGFEVHLTRLSDNSEVMNKAYGTHAKHYDINESFINDGIVHSDMSLEIVAITDHSGNKTSKKVQFHCHEK